MEYEDRTLFSATPLGADLVVQAAAGSSELVAPMTADASVVDAAPSSTSVSEQSLATTDDATRLSTESGRRELVVVDTSIQNYRQLVDDLTTRDDDFRRFEILLLDPSQDGLQQITERIAQYHDLSAIHFVTHAGPGELRLGDTRLTAAGFDAHSQQFALWRASLTDDADLLFYGCELAATIDGRALLASIEHATGADVAASIDNTGHALLGADWQLEYARGDVETQIAFSEAVQRQWINVLNATIDNVSSAIGNGQSTVTISHQTSGTDRLMLVGIGIDPHGNVITSVTYNGDSLTYVGAIEPGGSHSRVEIWALVAPDNGVHNVVINVSGSNYHGLQAGVITFTGVDQTTPLENFTTASGSSTSASVTVASRAGDIVFGIVHVHDTADILAGGGQTEQWDLSESPSRGAGSTAAGAASVVNTWTVGNDDWTTAGVSVRSATLTNTAPVLNAAESPALNSVNEDAAAPVGAVGTLISSLVDFNVPGGQVDNVTDPDAGALLGIAVTAADTTNGSWWYSIDGGSNWNALGSVSDGYARLLAADGNTRLYFQPNADYNGTISAAVTLRAWDQTGGTNGSTADTTTNGGTTAFSTATDTAAITVNAVNDAPVNTVPVAQTMNEGDTLTFSSGNGNAISIFDVDGGSGSVQVTLTATNGTITLSGTAGLSFTAGDGTSDATMTFTGDIADINTALDGLTFTPTVNFNGAAGLQVVSNDQGNAGSGGAQSDTDSVVITVNAVNDAPVITVPGAQSMNEDGALIFSSANGNAISIADVDAGSSAVRLTLTATNGVISLNGTTGLTFSSGDGTSDGAMTFTGTVSDINTALNGLTFTPSQNFDGAASLEIVANDLGNSGSGGALSDAETVSITVDAVNDAPTLTLPATQNTPFQTSLVFSSANGNSISLGDADAGSAPVRLSITPQNGTITLSQTTGLTFLTGTGSGDALVTVEGDWVDLNAALDGLIFTPDATYRGATTIAFTINDLGNSGSGGAQIANSQADVVVAPASSRLQFGGPADQAANNFQAVFSVANGNALQFTDVYGENPTLTVVITATNGTLTLATTQGLTVLSGIDGGSSISFSGLLSDVNAALNGARFSTTVSEASLSVYGTDPPRDGTGPQTAGGAIAITQPPIYPAPTTQPPTVETADASTDSDGDGDQDTAVIASLPAPTQSPAVATFVTRPSTPRAELYADAGATDGDRQLPVQPNLYQLDAEEIQVDLKLVSPSNNKSSAKIDRAAARAHASEVQVPWSRAVIDVHGSSGNGLSDELIVGTAGITASLSVGYVLWSVRAASMLSTMLSSMPAWQSFDPLPVINHVARRKSASADDDDTRDLF